MRYWLLKSEPEAYAWSTLVSDKRGRWDGVRNHQAAANLRAMRAGDQAVFYHSVTGKCAVGVMKVARTAYQDPTAEDGTEAGPWVAVDVVPLRPLRRPVTLAEMKSDPVLRGMAMLRQGRLSVSPLTAVQFRRIVALSERTAG